AHLTVVDGYGRTATTSVPVSVSAGSQLPPSAVIVASATSGNNSLAVNFSCNCQPGSAPIVAYVWDFGGVTSTESAPSIVFAPGRYRVRLTVIDGNGLTATDSV